MMDSSKQQVGDGGQARGQEDPVMIRIPNDAATTQNLRNGFVEPGPFYEQQPPSEDILVHPENFWGLFQYRWESVNSPLANLPQQEGGEQSLSSTPKASKQGWKFPENRQRFIVKVQETIGKAKLQNLIPHTFAHGEQQIFDSSSNQFEYLVKIGWLIKEIQYLGYKLKGQELVRDKETGLLTPQPLSQGTFNGVGGNPFHSTSPSPQFGSYGSSSTHGTEMSPVLVMSRNETSVSVQLAREQQTAAGACICIPVIFQFELQVIMRYGMVHDTQSPAGVASLPTNSQISGFEVSCRPVYYSRTEEQHSQTQEMENSEIEAVDWPKW